MQHTRESRLELKKLEDQLEILLREERSVANFFKEINATKMIDNVLNKMKLEPGLQKNNGMENLFERKNTKMSMKILTDHFFRQYSEIPNSQIQLLYSRLKPRDRFVPRRSFDLPAFYTHYCAENESIVDAMSRIPEAYLPGLDYINQEIDLLIADHGVSIAGPSLSPAHKEKSTENFSTNTHVRYESDRMTVVKFNKESEISKEFEEIFERPEEKILFHGHHFKLEDGQVIDEEENYFIKCYLNNNEIPDDWTIRKIQWIHGSEDVLVLFDQWFMGVGRIRKRKTSGDKNPFYLDLVEVVGSFGTTDFYTSPGFKTVLRICCYKREEPERREKNWESNKDLLKDIYDMSKTVEKMYKKMTAENDPQISHQEESESDKSNINALRHYCHNINLFLQIFQKYKDSPGFLDEFDFKSPRERLHYAFIDLQKTHRNKCRNGGLCANLKNFFHFCGKFMEDLKKKNPPSVMDIEFAKQFRAGLSMLYFLFANGQRIFDGSLIKVAESVLNPSKMYSLDARFVYLRYLNFPRYIRPMILDVLCRNELPSNHHLIHHIYGSGRDKNTQKKCEDDVVDAMKRHPHVILFSTNPTMPRIRLMKQLAHYWDPTSGRSNDSGAPGGPGGPGAAPGGPGALGAPGSRPEFHGSTGSTDPKSSDFGGPGAPGSRLQTQGSTGSTGSTDSTESSDSGSQEREGSVEKVEEPRGPNQGSPVDVPERSSEEPEDREPPVGRTPNKRAGAPLSPHQPIKIRKVVEVEVADRLAEDLEHEETGHDDDTTTDEPSPDNTMGMEGGDDRTPPPPVSKEPCSSRQAYGEDEDEKDNERTPSPPPASKEPCSSRQAYEEDERVRAQQKTPRTPKTPNPSETPKTPSDETPTRRRPGECYRTGEPEIPRSPAVQKLFDNFEDFFYKGEKKVPEVPVGQQDCLYQRTPARPPREEDPEMQSPAANTRAHDLSLTWKRKRF